MGRLTVNRKYIKFVQKFIHKRKLIDLIDIIDEVPPPTVIKDSENNLYYMVDGTHRAYITFKSGKTTIRVREGWKYFRTTLAVEQVYEFFRRRKSDPQYECPFVRFENLEFLDK